MNQSIKIIFFVFILGSLASCKKFLDVNENPNSATKAPINGLLARTTQGVALNVFRVSNITSYYVQYLASPNAASAADVFEPIDASNTWTNLYDNMTDAYDLQNMAAEAGATQYQGVAKVLMAMDLQQVHDLWGSGPYSAAFTGSNLTPAYDDAQTIYNTILQLLDDGIGLIQQPGSKLKLSANSDFIHKADTAAWIRTTHALKARMLNRVSGTQQYDAAAVLSEVEKAYTQPGQDASISAFDVRNPWNGVAVNNNALILDGWLSNTVIDAFNGNTYGLFDPRIRQLTDTTKFGDYRGTRNGQGRGSGSGITREQTYINLTGFYSSPNSPLYIITYEEVKFIEAEAAFRLGNTARAYAAYMEGIAANMNKLGISDTEKNAYINDASVAVGESNLTLSHIFKEKYKALFLSPETWSDARRFNYDYKNFTLPVNAATSEFVRRLVYPTVELSRNAANVPSVNSVTQRLWWNP